MAAPRNGRIGPDRERYGLKLSTMAKAERCIEADIRRLRCRLEDEVREAGGELTSEVLGLVQTACSCETGARRAESMLRKKAGSVDASVLVKLTNVLVQLRQTRDGILQRIREGLPMGSRGTPGGALESVLGESEEQEGASDVEQT